MLVIGNVDLAGTDKMKVVRVPAYSPYAVAEFTVALMLSLNRKIPRATMRTRDGNFSLHGLMGFDMHGKTAGIINGKIAKILIQILRGFGMKVSVYDPIPITILPVNIRWFIVLWMNFIIVRISSPCIVL